MAPTKKKEYSNDLREVVIKHLLNEDSKGEIARKGKRTTDHRRLIMTDN